MSSSENDPPHEAVTSDIASHDKAADEKAKLWSEADKRMLIIGFCGGLAANIGVVIVIGAAIAVDRFLVTKSPSFSSYLVAALSIFAIPFLGMFGALKTFRGIKRSQVYLIGFATFGILCLIGYAAGISK